MTCIVGVEDDRGAVVGGDAAWTAGWRLTNSAEAKVFRKQGLVIGMAGSTRVGQLVQFGDPWVGDAEPTAEWMVRTFVEWYRSLCRSGGVLKVQSGVEDCGATIIVGCRNRIFTIWQDFQVETAARGYQAVGSGESFAVGALAALDGSRLSGQERVKKALTAAAEHCASVSPPFVVERVRLRSSRKAG